MSAVATVITAPGIYDDIDEAAYHSGEWIPEPSLSVTSAKRLLRTSPARWKWEQENRVTKKAWDLGHAAHSKVLGVGLQVEAIPSDLLAVNGAASTKVAKEWIAECRAKGNVPLKPDEMAVVDAMAAALSQHAIAGELLSDGIPEQSMAWRDPETKIMLRGRSDWTTTYRDTPVIVDYKTCEDANPDEFRWDARRFDYHMQDDWYREMADALTGESHGFLFIVQEKAAPYLVSVIQLGDRSRRDGAERNRAARNLYLDLMTKDEWPAYPGITNLELP